jgi:hypothetical protein
MVKQDTIRTQRAAPNGTPSRCASRTPERQRDVIAPRAWQRERGNRVDRGLTFPEKQGKYQRIFRSGGCSCIFGIKSLYYFKTLSPISYSRKTGNYYLRTGNWFGTTGHDRPRPKKDHAASERNGLIYLNSISNLV